MGNWDVLPTTGVDGEHARSYDRPSLPPIWRSGHVVGEPQCGVGFEFVADNWTTKNYVFAPAAIYDGNRFDISYVRYAPYITDWEMPRKPNRPVVTTNIHHLNKNGKDARIEFITLCTPHSICYTRDHEVSN